MGYVPKFIHFDHFIDVLNHGSMNKRKVIYGKRMDYSFTHNIRDDPI